MDTPPEETPTTEPPVDGPTRTASMLAPRNRVGWMITGFVLLVLVAVVVWDSVNSGSGGDDAAAGDSATTSTIGSLRDLAEISGQTPGNEDPAPDFAVTTLDGGSFVLSDHLATDGRPVILNLWASWCLPCRAEMPAIDAFASDHPDVLIIGIAVQDDPQSAADFADEIGVAYPLAVDERDEVNNSYQPLGLPATFLISTEGDIVQRVFGGVTEESLAETLSDLDG